MVVVGANGDQLLVGCGAVGEASYILIDSYDEWRAILKSMVPFVVPAGFE